MARILSLLKCCPSFNYKSCLPGTNTFTFMDLFLLLLSIGSFIADICTDIIVIYQYYKHDHFMWLILTTSLVCIPSLIVQIFSIRWYIVDEKATNFVWIMHVFQLGLFYRFFQLLREGLRVRKSKSSAELDKFNHQQSDICMLRLFESFTESAPQLVLQLYIMVSTDEWNPWTGVSAVASIISLSWGIAAYSKAMRNIRPEKQRLSWWGLLFQSMWRIGMVSSRIVALVLFAVAYGYWLILALGVHLLCMIIWVIFQKTDFCTTWWEERLYNCVVGIIYCFCFFNLKEGRSRLRMIFYYVLTILQNTGFVLSFYLSETPSHRLRDIMCALVPGGIAIGLISMLLYYRFFHPSAPILLTEKTPGSPTSENKTEVPVTCCTLKTCRKTAEQAFTKTEGRPVSQSLYISNQMQANVNRSNITGAAISCPYDLHRAHSHNQNIDFIDNYPTGYNDQLPKNNLSVNHNLNCNFHPHMPVRSLSYRAYHSCLNLMKNSKRRRHNEFVNDKCSNSLPNLEFSFESGNSSLETSFQPDTSQNSESSSDSDMQILPVIYVDHIIKIKVETCA